MSDELNKEQIINAESDSEQAAIEISDKEQEKLQKKAERKEKAKKRRELRKERRANWKNDKKAIRNKKKEDLKNAPLIVRLWRLYLKVPVILFILVVFTVAVFAEDIENLYWQYQYSKQYEKWETRNTPVEDKSVLYEMSPLDEKGAKRIKQLPEYGEDDTWTFCLYIVGSNLEDYDENDLSSLTLNMTESYKEEAIETAKKNAVSRRERFKDELSLNGLDFPEYLYKVNKPIASSENVTKDVVVASQPGAASSDLQEIMGGLTSDNIKFVVQTGGATRWSNSLINPNKTQRFLITKDEIKEIENLPLQDSCSKETLTEFLKYCNDNYKSDHMAVIFWDHGSGYQGYGSDDIYDSSFSLADMKEAFSDAVKKDEEKPAYDIIGFDACLMATIEATHAFDGFAKYMVVSEELEPGSGWDYYSFLNMMAENKKMNAASVCQSIADTYLDFYMTQNVNVSDLVGNSVVTMSVIDVAEAENAYKAYCSLNKALIKDVVTDPKKIVTISRAALKAPVYGAYIYDRYSEIDLGVYMDYLSDYYPEECDAVRQALRKAVLYHRENDYLADSQGLSVFFPVYLSNNNGLGNALSYIYEVCEDKSTAALVYYKIAGCLNEEYTKYVNGLGCDKIKKIDTRLFREFDDKEIVIDDGLTYHIAVDSELEELIAGHKIEIAKYDKDAYTVTYYGRDECCELDGDGNIVSDFDGRWFAINGEMLEIELISSNDAGINYRSNILLNDVPYYLNFSYNPESDEAKIVSVAPIPSEDDVSVSDLGMKNTEELQYGDRIVIVRSAEDLSSGEKYDEYSDVIKYKESTRLEVKKLDDGAYLESIIISDTRGDSYYSAVVEFDISGGEAENVRVSREFVGIED